MKKVANQVAIDAVKDMQRGLRIAMEELIRQQNYRRTEEVLRELDFHMANWISDTKKV